MGRPRGVGRPGSSSGPRQEMAAPHVKSGLEETAFKRKLRRIDRELTRMEMWCLD